MGLLVITFFLLLAVNMPIGFTIGISGAVFFLTSGMIPFSITVQRVVAQTQSIAFLAVPFFIFAGKPDEQDRDHSPAASLLLPPDPAHGRRYGSG